MKEFFRCQNCLMPSTRPRISFNKDEICNACQYHEKKQKSINWDKRLDQLKVICKEYRRTDGYWDCIIPCSGGKDSTFIADLLSRLGMNPLTITFAPQIPSWLDRRNWENFVYTGFDNILITPNIKQYKKYAKDWLIKKGMPRQPFVTGISTAIIQTAIEKNINLIVFAENGEVEYGGDEKLLERFNQKFLIDIYYEGQYDQQKYGNFWNIPSQESLDKIYVTWMSNFVDWEPEEHAKLAVKKYGLEMPVGGNIGTFTNYSQIGDPGQDLHMYLCFLKYGFGRCCADVSIEIRRERLNKKEGLKIINELDGTFPFEFLDLYLDYFEMTKDEFWNTLKKFVNKDILIKNLNPSIDSKPWILRNNLWKK